MILNGVALGWTHDLPDIKSEKYNKKKSKIIKYGYLGLDNINNSGDWSMANTLGEQDYSNDFNKLIKIVNSVGDYQYSESMKFIVVSILIQFIVLLIISITNDYPINQDDNEDEDN